MKKLNAIMLFTILLLFSVNCFAETPNNSWKDYNQTILEVREENDNGSIPRSTIEQIVTGTIYNQSVLTLNISMNDILNVKIFDEFGSLLYTGTYSPSNPSAITVDVSSWDSGIYKVTLRKISNEPFLSGEFTIH